MTAVKQVPQLVNDNGRGIPANIEKKLETHAATICKHKGRAVESIIAIGRELNAANALLANHYKGTFGKWVEEQCGVSRTFATRSMQVAKEFEGCVTVTQHFEPTSLYKLSAPSCPTEAKDEAINRAEKGEIITAHTAQEIIDKHTEGSEPPDGCEELLRREAILKTLKKSLDTCDDPDELSGIIHWIKQLLKEYDHDGRNTKAKDD